MPPKKAAQKNNIPSLILSFPFLEFSLSIITIKKDIILIISNMPKAINKYISIKSLYHCLNAQQKKPPQMRWFFIHKYNLFLSFSFLYSFLGNLFSLFLNLFFLTYFLWLTRCFSISSLGLYWSRYFTFLII